MSKIKTVKGAREFYPEEMALRNYLYEKVRNASQAFGYQEWDGPFIETIDLYAAKSGEELVKKQSFTFEDRGGELVTLRPELTPSLASQFNFKGQKGVLVAEILSGSAPEASGIRAGDIITKVNSKEVRSVQEFEEALDTAKKAGSARLSIFRDGKFSDITLSLKP